ncbi:hypothetical protein PGUG_04620 [Meyerozyma guilliermondii ATCC 6260]|uniref:Uncharacterized protein n=1 Tax=Meyerozyma guilliermondii (strain ATCC 6260 / CBS 566 / DSM 6381 / JCM 1539 / NBRC 10279 / NRRL Y-324) TaxID=294746 RepID=A5DMW9_PICGU|nr:uncharacterized protein PGUG_04620 [Meyerozyma guilliermondii ATCC 6260]EDK40521.2 hypothetical protein PGUG_04620 [Meyerozyma guilliermondii ATCC 6260]
MNHQIDHIFGKVHSISLGNGNNFTHGRNRNRFQTARKSEPSGIHTGQSRYGIQGCIVNQFSVSIPLGIRKIGTVNFLVLVERDKLHRFSFLCLFREVRVFKVTDQRLVFLGLSDYTIMIVRTNVRNTGNTHIFWVLFNKRSSQIETISHQYHCCLLWSDNRGRKVLNTNNIRQILCRNDDKVVYIACFGRFFNTFENIVWLPVFYFTVIDRMDVPTSIFHFFVITTNHNVDIGFANIVDSIGNNCTHASSTN